MTSVTIPEGVTSIGFDSFCLCTSLTSVTIPASVTFIDMEAFLRCSSIRSITFEGASAPEIENEALSLGTSSSPVTCTVYSPGNWASESQYFTSDSYIGLYTTMVFEDSDDQGPDDALVLAVAVLIVVILATTGIFLFRRSHPKQ